MNHFKDLDLPAPLLENLHALGFDTMTPIQKLALPPILAGEDIIAQAPTGSGKSLAFLLPLILKLKPNQPQPQALIITPTRELAQQLAQRLQALARHQANLKVLTLYGGTSLTQQVNSLQKGADVLIGTPGRLIDHLSRQTLPLEKIETLILDEGDRMLEMGFEEDILKIASQLPKQRQSLLFSATYPTNIEQLSQKILHQPRIITAQPQQESLPQIQEIGYTTQNKPKALLATLQHHCPDKALIFCGTKVTTQEVASDLEKRGFDVATLHGDLEQYERQEMLLQFANDSRPLMVATDLAARGLDIEQIDLIINYDIPNKPQEYTHRIGRTGRAHAHGIAVTLCDEYALKKLPLIRPNLTLKPIDRLQVNRTFVLQGAMRTLCLDGGKKKKIRAGDILGTLCQEVGISSQDIGKIDVFDRYAYVAIDKSVIKKAYQGLQRVKIKKRKLRVWWL